jgi:hypothetical protein
MLGISVSRGFHIESVPRWVEENHQSHDDLESAMKR